MEMSPFFREALVVVLSIAGTLAAAWLWTRSRRNTAVLVFVIFAAAMSYLVAQWKLVVGL